MRPAVLRDLTKSDWLSLLEIPADRVPAALLLRGTRNLQGQYENHRRLFDRVLDVGSPNVLFEHVLIGERNGTSVGYASVYGAPMASEIVHLFGVLGTKLVLQSGCCGAWGEGVTAGDLFVPTSAFRGEGASQYYTAANADPVCRPTFGIGAELFRGTSMAAHTGGIYTTSALLAEGQSELRQWAADGWQAVDMETAATFAVARHFGMDCASLLYVFDNPLHTGDIVASGAELDERRRLGNEAMIDRSFAVIESYLDGGGPDRIV